MKVDKKIEADKVIYQRDASMKANNRSTINIYRLCASVISKLLTMVQPLDFIETATIYQTNRHCIGIHSSK